MRQVAADRYVLADAWPADHVRSAPCTAPAFALSAPRTRMASLASPFRIVSQVSPASSITQAAPDCSLRSPSRAVSRLPRSAADIEAREGSRPASAASPIRRSSARRILQTALMMDVLPQNGAQHEQRCVAVLAPVAASHTGARRRAEV